MFSLRCNEFIVIIEFVLNFGGIDMLKKHKSRVKRLKNDLIVQYDYLTQISD